MKQMLLVTNIPTPYRIPLFNELARQLEHHDVQLKVLFGRLGYSRRQWQVDMAECSFDYDVLSSRAFEVQGDAEKTMFTYGGVFHYLCTEAPDVVVVTGFSLATAQVWLYSWTRSLPYIIWTGGLKSTWNGQARKRISRSALRTLQRKVLVRRANAFVAYGAKARAYLIGLGAPPHTVHIGINTVDTHFFAEETRRLRRLSHDDAGRQHLVCVGYLSARKGTLKMLQAVQKVAKQRSDFVLDVVGDGEDRPRLEAFVRESGLSEHVRFHGYRQKEEVPVFLAKSCCLLYPTNYDIWGLVVVEAMAAGLPVMASVNAGATHDLVQEGETGFAVDFANTNYAVDKINWILDHPEEAAALGKRASTFIAEHVTIEKSAAGFVEAILDVLGREAPPRKPALSATPGATAIV